MPIFRRSRNPVLDKRHIPRLDAGMRRMTNGHGCVSARGFCIAMAKPRVLLRTRGFFQCKREVTLPCRFHIKR